MISKRCVLGNREDLLAPVVVEAIPNTGDYAAEGGVGVLLAGWLVSEPAGEGREEVLVRWTTG